MRPERLVVVVSLALMVWALGAHGAVVKAAGHFVITADSGLRPPSWAGTPAFRTPVATAAQDPLTVEGSLSLDRPTRRLIQQGLRNQGFDPGPPDGLFGPRTRAAIRGWQEARRARPTGYLDATDAEGSAPSSGVNRSAPEVPVRRWRGR